MKKNILASLVVILFVAAGLTATVFSQTPPPEPEDGFNRHVEINDKGRVSVRGAKITAIATSTISATQTWDSGAVVSWTVNADDETKYVSRHGVKTSHSDFAVGHTVSFNGWLVPGSPLTVRAAEVRNWSMQKEKASLYGVVRSIDGTAKSFSLETEEKRFGTVSVSTSDTTEFLKGRATTTFGALKVGDRVRARGILDRTAKTLQAEWVKIHVDTPRVLSGGKLKTLPGTTRPTSMVVTFGRIDYTVNVEVDTAVIDKRWAPADLADFRVNDHIRVYGVPDGTSFDATVVRNTNLPR